MCVISDWYILLVLVLAVVVLMTLYHAKVSFTSFHVFVTVSTTASHEDKILLMLSVDHQLAYTHR